MNFSPYGRNVMLFELSIVLRNLSVLKTFGFASLCQHNSPIRYALEQNTAMRLKLWAIGYGILAIGYWLLVMGWSVRLYHKLSPCPAGQKSKLSKPNYCVLSWDSLDLSSAASRRLYSVHLCSSVPISGK